MGYKDSSNTVLTAVGVEHHNFNCPYCNGGFETERGMKIHHTQCHGTSLLVSECKICQSSTKNKYCSRECFKQDCGTGDRSKLHNLKVAISQSNDSELKIDEIKVGEHPVFDPSDLELLKEYNKFDSSWEYKINNILKESNHSFKYNSSEYFPVFDINGSEYTPDFIVEDIIIEVKGSLGYIFNKDKCKKIADYMYSDSSYHYLVVGNVELQCNTFIPWDNRNTLPEIINNI